MRTITEENVLDKQGYLSEGKKLCGPVVLGEKITEKNNKMTMVCVDLEKV